MAQQTFLNVTESKAPRNSQPLPNLHFVVADDWIDKLSEKSFCLYLKLFTMVDRTDEDKSNHAIKTRQSKLIKKLDMSKSTYIRLMKPLYEYGLVDLIEYEGSKNEGSKPINIVVHRYPQNTPALCFEKLEKCRSWEQRTNENYNFTKQGGRPKKDKEVKPEPKPEPKKETKPAPKKQQVLAMADNVDPVVATEFVHFKDAMENNGADLGVVLRWVNKNAETISRNEMCFVFSQLANYAEPIKKTAPFIQNALKYASAFHTPVTLPKIHKETPAPIVSDSEVPFYNWLEEDGSQEPVNQSNVNMFGYSDEDEDMPF